MQGRLCPCTAISVSSLCVFAVAAVLEGVHFSFGSRPDPILFQVVILGQSAMPVKKKEKKEYPICLDCIFF